MTYKVKIESTITCSYDCKDIFDYIGLNLKDLRGQIAGLAYHHIATCHVFLHDPRFQREFYLREVDDKTLENAKKFMTYLFDEVSEQPGSVIEVHFIKEKGYDNPEGV